MIAQDPVGPGSRWESRFVGIDRLVNDACLPCWQVDELEIKGQVDLVELLTIVRHQLLDRQIQFANEHALTILLGQCTHLLHDGMHPWLVDGVLFYHTRIGEIAWLPGWIDSVIAEVLILEEHFQRVYTKAINTSLQPEAQDLIHSLTNVGVAPIQIRLFYIIGVQVVLPGLLIKLPGWPAKPAHPVIGRTTIGSRIAPDVPVAFPVRPARA